MIQHQLIVNFNKLHQKDRRIKMINQNNRFKKFKNRTKYKFHNKMKAKIMIKVKLR